MKRYVLRAVAGWVVTVGVIAGFVVAPASAEAAGGVPVRVHVQQSGQYLYTTLIVPLDVGTLQSGLGLASLSFDGQPVTIVSSGVDGMGVWQLVVNSSAQLQAGNSVLRLYDGANLVPMFDVSLPMHLVPRNPANLSPDCDVVTAVLNSSAHDCQGSYEDGEVVEPPDEPSEPVDPKPTESTPVRPVSSAPASVAPVQPAAPVAVAPAEDRVPVVAVQEPSTDSRPNVLSQSASVSPASVQTTPAKEFELTPVVAAASVAAGIAVAGAGALVVNKLGINKPKL